MGNKAEVLAAKERAIELAGKFWPVRAIAIDLGCSRSTVQRYLAAYRKELPTPAYLRQQRMHIALAEAHGIDDVLRVMSVARHFEDRERDVEERLVLPKLATVEGRQEAVELIATSVGNGRLSPAQAQAMLACVKEASDLDALGEELRRIDELEARIINGTVVVADTTPPEPSLPAA